MALERSIRPTVVKVGGSLFDLPDLGARLTNWLQTRQRVLLVPGGGPSADVVRHWDHCHHLGEERAHWLALYALALNARFLAALLPRAVVVESPEACAEWWQQGTLPVLDAHAFARADEGRPGCVPHSWDATSDTLAARVAQVAGARTLVLLKSAPLPPETSWAEAGRTGFVDPCFAAWLRPEVEVETVCLRPLSRARSAAE